MAIHLQRSGILRRQDLQTRIGLKGPLQIEELFVDFRHDGSIGQTRD